MTRPELILLDMDNVVADWGLAAATTCSYLTQCDKDEILRKLDAGEMLRDASGGLSRKEFDEEVMKLGTIWWESLTEMADRFPNVPLCLRLYDACAAVAPTYFLTALPPTQWNHHEVAAGKLTWLRQRLGQRFQNVFVCPRSAKALLARNAGAVLVDDSLENCNGFIKAGGGAVHYLAPAVNELNDPLPTILRLINRAARGKLQAIREVA